MSNRRDPPSFFKVLVGDFKNKLCLPKATRTKISVNGKILLTNPITRRSWLVSVKKDENDLFLFNEWMNFANDNDLHFGEFLVFRSSGESEFNVKIFGRNGCEKEFPICMENNEGTQSDETEFQNGTQPNIGEESDNEETVPMNNMTNLGVRDTGNQVEETADSLIVTFNKSKKYNFYVARWWVEVTCLGKKDRVMFLDPNDKLWPVDIIHKEIGDTFLSTGWSDFCKASRFDIGDTLRFQIVHEDTIRVEIIQRNVDSSGTTTLEEASARDRREKIIAKSEFTSDKPYFSITMRSTYVGGNFTLCLPGPFSMTFIGDEPQDVILWGSKGGSWIANYTVNKKQYRLGKGWRKFVSDNKLKENDICVFELIKNRNPMELKVYIFPCI